MPIFKKVNKDFFKKWDNDMAYVLGFLFADGNVSCNNRGAWFWSIQITDKEILEMIKDGIGSDHKISTKKKILNNKLLFRLQIGSKEMCNDLSKLGLKERKSKNMSFPDVPKKYFGDVLRGYFDGDGGVWVGYLNKKRTKKTHVISTYFTSGSLKFLEILKDNLNHFGVNGGFIVKKEKGYDLKFSIDGSLKIFKIMYNSNSPFFLERKRVVFEKYISSRRSSTG